MSLNGLTFDSIDKLRRFVETAGKEFLAPIIKLDNVHLDDASPPKVGSLYHVVTGAGKYIRHYSLSRKSANVVLEVDTSKGINDGLVKLRVRTRNKVGIAQGSPLLLNFGQDYDHDAITKAIADEGSQPKKLKNMLQVYFAKLGREAEAAAASAEAGSSADTAASAGSSAETAAGSGDSSATGSAGSSAETTATTTAGAGSSTAGSAGSAGSSGSADPAETKANPAGTAGAAGAAGGGAGAAGATGSSASELKKYMKENETLVAEIAEPMKMGLAFLPPKGGDVGSLTLCCPGLVSNKKIPPKTMLLKISDGKVGTSTVGGVKWHFPKTKNIMVVTKEANGKLGPLTSLFDFIQTTGATSVVRHGPSPFPGKKPPMELTPGSDLAFLPTDASMAAVLTFCLTRSDIVLVWLVRLNSEKAVVPHGVAIYTKKQAIMPVSGRLGLN